MSPAVAGAVGVPGRRRGPFVTAEHPRALLPLLFRALIKLSRDNNQIAAAGVNGTSEPCQELYLMRPRPGVVQVPFQALI